MKDDYKHIFITGTPRSGGRLVSNIYSLHSECFVLSEVVYFFRHIYKRYKKINEKNLKLISGDIALRLLYRNDIKISHKELFSYFLKNKVNNYFHIYIFFFKFLKKKQKNKSLINIEAAGNEWRYIDDFLRLNSNFKVLQFTRDPRAMLSSFKKITFLKDYSYLVCLFQWIDSIQYYQYLKKKYKINRYRLVKFEDIHSNPKKTCGHILNLCNLKYKRKNFLSSNWINKLKKKNLANISSYNMKPVYGFSTSRINNWQNYLEEWEIALTESLCSKYMKHLNYLPILKKNSTNLKKAMEKVRSDKKIKKIFDYYKKNKKIKKIYMNDPSNPKNWGSNKNYKAKFIETIDYKKYKNALAKLIRGHFIS